MPIIKLYVNKSLEENASIYYEKAKKFKNKLEGARKALEASKAKLKEVESKYVEILAHKKMLGHHFLKREWYEKFRWFISSEGFLVLGGRDSSTNDILIKKFTEKNDLVFHTEMAGSPFFVIKSDNKVIGEQTKQEIADAVVSYSRAWKLGITSTEVFYVTPEQISKKAPTGEYIKKGAFMIYGKKSYIQNNVNLAIGINDKGKIIGGPVNAIKSNCKNYVEIRQGRKKSSDVAKLIQKKIGGNLDEIIRVMPSGGCEVK